MKPRTAVDFFLWGGVLVYAPAAGVVPTCWQGQMQSRLYRTGDGDLGG